ncbi:MAG: SUMF1/EgtB/PvdO family nonheme iron enzyme [Oscillibacter sp.]|nr:SUMF1/EgtB/PvdO family nonheme iron enzyme [Oscillibacter sp.]
MKCHIFKNIGKIILLTSLIFPTLSPAKANNIRITGKPQVVSFIGNDTAIVELNLSWDNSWRDDFNWDAAWIFIKYKKRGALAPWHHAYLTREGHEATPLSGNEGGDHTFMFGETGSGANAKVTGVYLMRDAISEGKVNAHLRLKWIINANPQNPLTIADFGDDLKSIYVAVHGIEMVYIPYGSYYLGDAYSDKSFAVGDTAAVFIDSENALTLSAINGMPNVSLSASYPKGYAGFYIMKYETSQEQYVEFLNSLTLEQQKARVANNKFSTMKRGDYVFGNLSKPNCRNGIVFIEQKGKGGPAVFGNNLNPNNDLFSTDDGQTLACNYMSVEDMIAYSSWCGLRPMSELEYEKACRRFYPQIPDKGEYAWNTNSDLNHLNGLSDLNNQGDQQEQALSYLKNVNSGTNNSINGPVRCGLFATSSTNQTQAGATYWGVMEMSGNLKELCMSVGNPNFIGSSSGTGEYNAAYWNTAVGSYGVRGGGFTSADNLLRTSDRTEAMNYFTSISQRDSTVGFRLARTLTGSISVNPGTISLSGPLCPGVESTILETEAASISGMSENFPLSYTWSYSIDNGATWIRIADATSNSLNYSDFLPDKTYLFRRTAVCAVGEASIQTIGIVASAMTEITKAPADMVNAPCNLSLSVTTRGSNLTYQWQKDGVDIAGATGATYAKTPSVPSDAGVYVCRISGTCGSIESKKIYVSVGGFEDGILTDPRDGQTYKIRKMPDGHWWMVENLRFGTCNASTFRSYYKTSTVNQIASGYYGVCIAGTGAGTGHMYNWQAAMNHPKAASGNSGNPSGNVNGNCPNQWQGICPEGWHLPSGGSTGEFQKLYTSLCNDKSKIYPGSETFEGVLEGYISQGYFTSIGSDVLYWSNMPSGSTYAYTLYVTKSTVSPQHSKAAKWGGFAVRCVKNY